MKKNPDTRYEPMPVVRKDCPCPKTSCKRFTLCDECEAAHLPKGGLPYCRRPRRSFQEWIRKIFGFSK